MLSQCPKCGLSKSSGAMGSVLPQCQCDWRMPSTEDAPLVKWVKEQTAPQRTERLKACVYCGQLVAKEKNT